MPDAKHDIAAHYHAHARGLLAFLCARLRDEAWAEDVLHDVFVGYMRQGPQGIESPKAYLYAAAHRRSLNAMRDRAIDKRATQAAASGQYPWVTEQGADPLLAEAARAALADLPTEEGDVVVLRVYSGMTFEEVARVLDCPMTTVHRRHAKAMAHLRRMLDGQGCSRRVHP